MKQHKTVVVAEKRAYRIPEFCATHGIGRSKAYEEIAAGRLKMFKCGRTTLISRDAADAWIRLLDENA